MRAIYASFTSTSTSSVARSAIVTTAPRVKPPPTLGATTSPTSASLRSTVPVNGARMIVFSLLATARRTPASATRCRAAAAFTRASACAARLSPFSSSCGETRFAFCVRTSRRRLVSRTAWSRSACASMSVASDAATFASA